MYIQTFVLLAYRGVFYCMNAQFRWIKQTCTLLVTQMKNKSTNGKRFCIPVGMYLLQRISLGIWGLRMQRQTLQEHHRDYQGMNKSWVAARSSCLHAKSLPLDMGFATRSTEACIIFRTLFLFVFNRLCWNKGQSNIAEAFSALMILFPCICKMMHEGVESGTP